MEKKESISKILVNYGPREEHIINEIKELALPDNKNEILRRGLHDVRFLADVDENFYLTLLSQLLHLGATRYDTKILKLSKEMAYVIHAIKVSKYGVVQSEIFESIPRELQSIEKLINDARPDPVEIEEDFKISMKKLADSIDTVFRKYDEKESESNMLFLILFLNHFKNNKHSGKVRLGEVMNYEKIASDQKREFLKKCVLIAEGSDDKQVKKFENLLTIKNNLK